MPSEQPSITPLAGLPWDDPIGNFVGRAFTSALICSGLSLAGSAVFWTFDRDPFIAVGSLFFLLAVCAVQAIVASVRIGWKRFALFMLINVGMFAAVGAGAFAILKWTLARGAAT